MSKLEIIDSSDIDSLTIEDLEVKDSENKKSSKSHYVDNNELQEAFIRYNKMKRESLERGEGVPPLTDEIAEAILKIAQNLVHHHHFNRAYGGWKEEMIGEGVLACVRYIHNYDPEKYENPFGYITQTIKNAFYESMRKNRKHIYIQAKLIQQNNGFYGDVDEELFESGNIHTMTETGNIDDWNYNKVIEEFEYHEEKRKEKKKKKTIKKAKKKQTDDVSLFDLGEDDDQD